MESIEIWKGGQPCVDARQGSPWSRPSSLWHRCNRSHPHVEEFCEHAHEEVSRSAVK